MEYKATAHGAAGSCCGYSQAPPDLNKRLCSWASAALQFGKDITSGPVPGPNAAPSISSLASYSYDGLDLETICSPSACIQLSLGQQSPFQLQPPGMRVGKSLPLLLSAATKPSLAGDRHQGPIFCMELLVRKTREAVLGQSSDDATQSILHSLETLSPCRPCRAWEEVLGPA